MPVHIGTHLDLQQPIASRFLKWDLEQKKLLRVKFREAAPPALDRCGKGRKTAIALLRSGVRSPLGSQSAAFPTGVRFAIDTIEMIEIDDKLSARTGITPGENWLAVRGFPWLRRRRRLHEKGFRCFNSSCRGLLNRRELRWVAPQC